MIRSITESLKILRSHMPCTALPWIPKLTASIPQSRRRMESLWPVWLFMKQ